ncbi:MAG: hypothetical protein RIQ89_1616 [Bacteroidota bacterium]|jgi:outer membrane receptor protein involved in Fe transport
MGRKLRLLFALFFFTGTVAIAQNGEIRGKISEKGSGEPVPFASVAVYLNGSLSQAGQTDFDGLYSIKPLTPGKYSVKITCIGYNEVSVEGVTVKSDAFTKVDAQLGKGIELKEAKVYAEKLIDPGSPSSQVTKTYEEIQSAPIREVNAVAALSAGVFQKEEGDALNIRGSRSDATTYFVDGIKVRGSVGISNKGTEQVTVITGGLPAQYGDVTGGVINVTTRGPSQEFTATFEAISSRLFDKYRNDLFSTYIAGPILSKKAADGSKTPLLGFSLAGDYQFDGDPSPLALGSYKVKDSFMKEIQETPIVRASNGPGFVQKANFTTLDSLEKIKARQNVESNAIRLNGKLDIRPVKNLFVTLGGSFERTDGRSYINTYALFNSEENNQVINNNWRAFGRLTQRFPGNADEKSQSKIRNAYYTLQFDISRENSTDQNVKHKDRFFDYGYVGKFTTTRVPFRIPTDVVDPLTGDTVTVPVLLGYADSQVNFQQSDLNPYMSNFTQTYFDLAPSINGYSNTLFDIPLNGGLINGDNRNVLNVYGLWASAGRVRTGYRITNNRQYRITAMGSADIKKHNIVVGMEYEQRSDRSWGVSPSGLWSLMRSRQNFNIQNFDASNPIYIRDANGNLTAVDYNFAYAQAIGENGNPTRGFFENVRDKIGVAYDQLIDIDSYDPSTFSLDMFAADELFQFGGAYYGYDYLGNFSNERPSLKDFFNERDANNNLKREIAPFEPIYVAGYIQDKFIIEDLNFNIGLRVDRFDANQQTLKDPYLLYSAYAAGEDAVKALAAQSGQIIPSNIGSNYVVYVNDAQNPTSILGYRDPEGNRWYNAIGEQIVDVKPLTNTGGNTSGTIQPFLSDKAAALANKPNETAFKDYEPQTNFMPRIAFSFPVSDDAYFSAHYDLLTQRPDQGLLRMNPWNYVNLAQGISGNLPNPDLKPTRTTDYEIKFKQKVSKSSVIELAAFYREMRDMVTIINVQYAYPVDYTTFGNQDFGTVKGFSLNYDLRRTGNIRMNAAYTLQFAEGTGSDAFTNSGVIAQQGQVNLRSIRPLNFDQRHTIVTSFDYHYGNGKDYDGPVVGNSQIFANAGFNVVFRGGSGTPYSRRGNITPEQDFLSIANSRQELVGEINGSRLPWNFNIDARIDKTFNLTFGKSDDKKGHQASINVFFQILNVLDAQRVIGVYTATGSPTDDGYLSSTTAQSAINGQLSPQAYRDLYTLAMLNPGSANFSLPRRVRFGILFNF